VGEGVSQNVPLYEARGKVLEAADCRRRLNGVMGGLGQKRGTETKQMTPREAAAWVISPVSNYLGRVTGVLT